MTGMHELFKSMEPVVTKKDQIIFKYGGTSTDCFFILQGQVAAKAPTLVEQMFSDESEFIYFCSQNYKEIIWEKLPNGQYFKIKTQIFIKDQSSPGKTYMNFTQTPSDTLQSPPLSPTKG